jgi:hypothetical protein
MTSEVLRKILVAGVAVAALSVGACKPKTDTTAASDAASTAASDTSSDAAASTAASDAPASSTP